MGMWNRAVAVRFGRAEEPPDSRPGPLGRQGKGAPRNRKWGHQVGNRLVTTTATESSPASGLP